MRAVFQMEGTSAVATDKLNTSVKYCTAFGPMCLRCQGASPSGPNAVEFLEAEMAAFVSSALNGAKERSRGWFLSNSRRTLRVSRVETGGGAYCLTNPLAICFGEEREGPPPKEICWFLATGVLFPCRPRRSRQ